MLLNEQKTFILGNEKIVDNLHAKLSAVFGGNV